MLGSTLTSLLGVMTGTLKSPAAKKMVGHLFRVQRRLMKEYQAALQEYEDAVVANRIVLNLPKSVLNSPSLQSSTFLSGSAVRVRTPMTEDLVKAVTAEGAATSAGQDGAVDRPRPGARHRDEDERGDEHEQEPSHWQEPRLSWWGTSVRPP